MTPNTLSAEAKLYPILPCNSESCFVPADTRTPNFIYLDRRSRDRQLSLIAFDLGQVSTLGQESTLHSLCLMHPEFLLIQLVSAGHLKSMVLCLKDCLPNAFLIYILLQLVKFRCRGTDPGFPVGGRMARMNLRGRGTIILSVLLWASTRSQKHGMGKEHLQTQISLVLCSRNFILSKVLKADPIRTLQLERNVVRTEEFPRYYSRSTADMTTYPAGWASWHSLFDWKFALGLLRAMGERSYKVEYPRTLDERAGAAAVVAQDELHIDGA